MRAPMVVALADGRWTPEQLASALVPRRDRLVTQLPREIAAARDLSRDECELVVDESLDFIVTEYTPADHRHGRARAGFLVRGIDTGETRP